MNHESWKRDAAATVACCLLIFACGILVGMYLEGQIAAHVERAAAEVKK